MTDYSVGTNTRAVAEATRDVALETARLARAQERTADVLETANLLKVMEMRFDTVQIGTNRISDDELADKIIERMGL